MGSAREIVVRPIAASVANEAVRRIHYSGKVVRNSQLHIGVFWRGRLEGAMQFGPSLDKRKIQGLVADTRWNGFIELNRMAFSDALPRNSESRAIGVTMRLLRKHKPTLEWVVSFADATQCGDGTIYRASGFVLTDIRRDGNCAIDGAGRTHHKMTYETNPVRTGYYAITGGTYNWKKYVRAMGWQHAVGFQLRYVYFLNAEAKSRLTVPTIPFSEIRRRGANMYRGNSVRSETSDTPADQAGEGGAAPTRTLCEVTDG